jgi:hypothetical protein
MASDSASSVVPAGDIAIYAGSQLGLPEAVSQVVDQQAPAVLEVD